MAEITVAVVQMAPILGDLETNLQHMAETVDRICSTEPTDLIVFPELATTGVENGVGFNRLAERVPGHQFNVLATRAANYATYIVFGLPTKEKVESIFYNAAVVIGPDGELVGEYRKLHLKGEEKLSFRPGYRFSVFDTAFGVLGVMIGWDIAFPEAARSLVLLGAEILCVPAYETPYQEEWRAFTLARAVENGSYLLAANRVGEEPSREYFGESCIVAPDGARLSYIDDPEAETPTLGYAYATIDTDRVRQYREEMQIIMSRSPSAYSPIVKKY